MRSSDELCKRFRSLRYKITPQRRYIFQVLEGNTEHMSAEEVYSRVQAHLPDISLATVYNTLRELVELGELRQLNLGEGRSRFDPNTGGHQHLICVRCSRVTDVQRHTGSTHLPAEERHGYDILGADVTWYGVCPVCQASLAQEGEEVRHSNRMWGVPSLV